MLLVFGSAWVKQTPLCKKMWTLFFSSFLGKITNLVSLTPRYCLSVHFFPPGWISQPPRYIRPVSLTGSGISHRSPDHLPRCSSSLLGKQTHPDASRSLGPARKELGQHDKRESSCVSGNRIFLWTLTHAIPTWRIRWMRFEASISSIETCLWILALYLRATLVLSQQGSRVPERLVAKQNNHDHRAIRESVCLRMGSFERWIYLFQHLPPPYTSSLLLSARTALGSNKLLSSLSSVASCSFHGK